MTYSSSIAIGRQQRYARPNQNSVSFSSRRDHRLGPISNTVILIVLACLLGLLYLTQVTKTNAYGYTINDLKTQQSQLETKHDDLMVASARLQSLNRVEKSSTAQNMVPIKPTAAVKR